MPPCPGHLSALAPVLSVAIITGVSERLGSPRCRRLGEEVDGFSVDHSLGAEGRKAPGHAGPEVQPGRLDLSKPPLEVTRVWDVGCWGGRTPLAAVEWQGEPRQPDPQGNFLSDQ